MITSQFQFKQQARNLHTATINKMADHEQQHVNTQTIYNEKALMSHVNKNKLILV